MHDLKESLQALRKLKNVSTVQTQRFLSLIIPAATTLLYAIWTTSSNGDQGWDSNAYHLPISGLLLYEGSNNFDSNLANGTYTIFTPYGSHVLAGVLANSLGTFMYSSLITWLAVFSLTLIAYGYILDNTKYADKKSLTFILPSSLWLIPSVFGQTSHFYIDALCGTFIAAMFIFFSKILDLGPQRKVIWLTSGLMGSAAIATKSVGFYPLSLMVLILLIYVLRKRIYLHLLFFALPFALLGLIPYLRNLIYFSNPIYPITFLNFPGRISTSEISSSFEYFVPPYWSDNNLVRLVMSLFVGAVIVSGRVILSQLGHYDPNRNDLSGFSYDTTYGGAGPLTSLIFFSVFCVALWRLNLLFKQGHEFRMYFTKKPLTSLILLAVPIGASVLMPGSWWPRYNLGNIFILLILAFRFLANYSIPKLIHFCMSSVLILVSLFQLMILVAYTTKYENPMAHANVSQFNPNFGLTQNIELPSKCERLVFVEPRPTFTSAFWTLGCRNYAWTSTPAIFHFKDGDYAVFNPAKYLEFENSHTSLYAKQQVRAWFDSKGDYGSIFIFFKESR